MSDFASSLNLALHISADVLRFDKEPNPDHDLLRLHFEAVFSLDPDEKSVIKELMKGMLPRQEAHKLLRSLQKQVA